MISDPVGRTQRLQAFLNKHVQELIVDIQGSREPQEAEAAAMNQLIALRNSLFDRAAEIKAFAVAEGIPAVLMENNPQLRDPVEGDWG